MPSNRRPEIIVSFNADGDFDNIESLDVMIGIPDEIWPDMLAHPDKLKPIFEDALLAAIRATAPVGTSLTVQTRQVHTEMDARLFTSKHDKVRFLPLSMLRAKPNREDLN